MRIPLLALAVLVLGHTTAAPAAEPPLPPIVFQAQPAGRLLNDLRTGADLIAGDKGVQALNDGLKSLLGEKGFQGLDMGRPVVGYVVLAPKPEDITAVVALPISEEKEFLELCDRVNKAKLTVDAKDKTLYHLPPLDPRYKALMRFHDRYAYIAYGARPEPHIDVKALVPMEKLFDPAERGLVSGRVHFDRIPLPVKLAAGKLLEEVKKNFMTGPGIGKQEQVILQAITAEWDKLLTRYIKYAGEAAGLSARLVLDAPGGNLVVETVLSGKSNSDLAKSIAGFKPTTNNFAALLNHPESVGGLKLRLPIFQEEARNALAAGIGIAQKEALKTARDVSKPAAQEFFEGLARTVKTGEFDIVAGMRGPDKNGWFTALGVLSFDDPSKLEKEFKTFVEKDAPQDAVDAIKWDAARVGTVGIHTWKQTPGGFIDVTKVFGGADCSVAFAFGRHGIFIAMGPDAVGTVKDALAVKPIPAPVFEVLINPVRFTKLLAKIMGPEDPDLIQVENVLGKEDKLVSVMAATVEGGRELRVAFTLNLKVLPRAAVMSYLRKTDNAKDTSPPAEKK